MAGSEQGDSPTPDDLRRGSTASNADDVFESPPSTPTPDTPRDLDAERDKGESKDSLPPSTTDKSQLAPPVPAPTLHPSSHSSSSSLNLPLIDPTPTLKSPSATTDELLASLRSQVSDLASQVTGLNLKLVKSYTTRGELEDDLHDKEELSQRLLRRVSDLEKDKQKWEKEIEVGGWVEKTHVQGEMQRLMTKMVEETKSRENAVQAHTALESEIESLTSNLFTEANKMVAFERLARARAEEKMRSIEESGVAMQALLEEVQVGLKDTIGKLEKRDTEIADLKKRLAAHGEHVEEDAQHGGEPVDGDIGGIMFSDGEHMTPDAQSHSFSKMSTSVSMSQIAVSAPRLLTTVLPYHEFLNFVTYLRQLRVIALTPPREGAGYGAHPLMAPPSTQHLSPSQLLAPHLLLSTHITQPFLKRCVEEDSDPALRLDIAPGLGFLSRRTIGTAIVDGSLLIEPLHAGAELPSDKCALCGCSLEMWLANSGHPVSKGKNAKENTVNQTMRKMLGSSIFSRSTSSGASTPTASSSSSVAHGISSAYHSAASSTDSFSFPPPLENASHHPHDASLQVHLFRASDTASQRYPICPSYCLSRLRAVCEFWTYVRVIERGLLLEEGFKFVQGRGGSTDDVTPALSRQASFVRSGSSAGARTPTKETSASEGLGLGPVAVGDDGADVAREFEVEDTEEGRKNSVDGGETPKLASDVVEGRKSTSSARSGGGGDIGGGDIGDLSSADLTRNSSAGSASSKPVRPARSSARNSPIVGSFPSSVSSPPSSPNPSSAAPALPPRRPASASGPAPPPRHPTSLYPLDITGTPGGSSSSLSASHGAGGGAGGENIVANAIGWEDRCWSEVVRLKESVFWTRVAAVAPDGAAVSSRGARVWVQ